MKSYAKSWILKASLIVIFIVIDLLSKYFLQRYFETGGDVIVVIRDFFNLEYVKNTGVAFGMFKNNVVASLIFPVIFLVVFVVYDVLCKTNKITYIFGFSLIISGAIGNLYDRIILKFVRDFFAIRIFPFVFNFADACVTIGFVLIVVSLLIDIVKKDKVRANQDKPVKENKDELSDNKKNTNEGEANEQ